MESINIWNYFCFFLIYLKVPTTTTYEDYDVPTGVRLQFIQCQIFSWFMQGRARNCSSEHRAEWAHTHTNVVWNCLIQGTLDTQSCCRCCAATAAAVVLLLHSFVVINNFRKKIDAAAAPFVYSEIPLH